MPNCFSLTKKGETKPTSLPDVDEALCAFLDIEPDADKYYAMWVNIEGLGFAMGKTMEDIRRIDPNPHRQVLRDWLEDNYTVDAWAEVARR